MKRRFWAVLVLLGVAVALVVAFAPFGGSGSSTVKVVAAGYVAGNGVVVGDVGTSPCATPGVDINNDGVCGAGDVHLELDMDVTNGTGPCNPVDPSATYTVGTTYKVAVCLTSAGVSE